MNQPISDTIKCVGVRFFANPELEDRTVPETEEMCRKTIGVLEHHYTKGQSLCVWRVCHPV